MQIRMKLGPDMRRGEERRKIVWDATWGKKENTIPEKSIQVYPDMSR